LKLMVFLPCLNEAKTIAQIIEQIPRSISGVDLLTNLPTHLNHAKWERAAPRQK